MKKITLTLLFVLISIYAFSERISRKDNVILKRIYGTWVRDKKLSKRLGGVVRALKITFKQIKREKIKIIGGGNYTFAFKKTGRKC